MKRRNFLKGILGGVVIGPSALKATTQNIDKSKKSVKEYVVYLGLLYEGIETTSKDYHRIKSPKNWEFRTDSILINTEEIQFPICESSWGDINEFAFYDEEKDGNMLVSGKLVRQVFISSGDTITFPAHYIKITL